MRTKGRGKSTRVLDLRHDRRKKADYSRASLEAEYEDSPKGSKKNKMGKEFRKSMEKKNRLGYSNSSTVLEQKDLKGK